MIGGSAERDPTRRFSNRVEDYVRYRPGYPPEVLDLLERECGIGPGVAVADVGSGTGILTEPLLRRRARVFAVEPNPEMRAAGERRLGSHPGFTSVAGRAEATTLPGRSVALVTAAQAFHWFDPAAARAEFARILRPGGSVAVVWNERRVDSSPFLQGYEALLHRHAPDYARVDHRRLGAREMADFFAPAGVRSASFEYRQRFDIAGVAGRLLSSSYAPAPGEPGHQEMMADVRELFARTAHDGTAVFEYDTRVYWGVLDG